MDTDYSSSSYTRNSYCVADVTVEGCENITTLYAGGLIGSSIKEDTTDSFDNFYYDGTVTVKHDGDKSAGLLFGAISDVGSFTNFNYNVGGVTYDTESLGLCGNMMLSEDVLNNFRENSDIGNIITSSGYTVKELDPVSSVVTYENEGTAFTIINTYQTQTPATGDSNLPMCFTALVVTSLLLVVGFACKKKIINLNN